MVYRHMYGRWKHNVHCLKYHDIYRQYHIGFWGTRYDINLIILADIGGFILVWYWWYWIKKLEDNKMIKCASKRVLVTFLITTYSCCKYVLCCYTLCLAAYGHFLTPRASYEYMPAYNYVINNNDFSSFLILSTALFVYL